MKIYITRHGQVITQDNLGDVQFPAGDPHLTPIGREQAACLGKYLKHIGFSGRIYSSPYARSLETAQVIADYTGSQIVPWAPMRQIVKCQNEMQNFVGMTIEQMKEEYPSIASDARLPYPWWTTDEETADDVTTRIRAAIAELPDNQDILLVGHSVSVVSACDALQVRHKGGNNINCSFSVHDTENPNNFKFLDDAHLPYAMRTFNSLLKSEADGELLQPLLDSDLSIPVEPGNTRILHITDTASYVYPYVEKIIQQIRPHIIIHTGDFVDEIKSGRMPGTQQEYTQRIAQLAQILRESGAEKIYAVPGNNDILPILKEYLPFAELVTPNTVVNICGIDCALGHSCTETIAPAQWSFYGHGFSGETWSVDQNDLFGKKCRFNGIWGYSVFQMPSRRMIYFPVAPEFIKNPI